MKYYNEIKEIFSKIDFQQFRPVWTTVKIIKDQNLPIKVYQKNAIGKHMHDYFAGYISYDQMVSEVSKIEKEYKFKFDWTQFPKDFRKLELSKLLRCKQIYKENDEYEYDSNQNLVQIYNKLNNLLGIKVPHDSWHFYVFYKWDKFPSLDPISINDFICTIICFGMFDEESDSNKILKKLELTEEDLSKFDYQWYMSNVVFNYNRKVS